MQRSRRSIIESNEVSEMVTLSLGGFPQKVLIDGAKESNPVVLVLHGGPGSPIPFCAGCRGMFPELTAQFTMVYWDQLGCGINDQPLDNGFTIERFVEMTVELLRALRRRFPTQRLCILGMSWGSVLAARAAKEVPELLHGVLIYGQVLRRLFFNDEVFETLEQSAMPSAKRAELAKLREKPQRGLEDLQKMAGFITRYTDGYQCKQSGKMPIFSVIRGIAASPDYTLRDMKAMVMNGYRSNTALPCELLALDLTKTLCSIRVPYCILQGSTDIVTSTRMLETFVSEVKNPHLSLEIVPDNGHMPGKTGMDAMMSRAAQLFCK